LTAVKSELKFGNLNVAIRSKVCVYRTEYFDRCYSTCRQQFADVVKFTTLPTVRTRCRRWLIG